VGTLLGITVPYVFQRMNARHVERFARDERLRQERRPWVAVREAAVAPSQSAVISLCRVRVSGKHLHIWMLRALT
jgi:hypothetical protein